MEAFIMMVSTKGRYALRVMVDLALHDSGAFIPLADIARRQEISEKYLESIVSLLAKAGLLDSIRGKGGGYKLNRRRSDYTVLEILTATEGPLGLVSCLTKEKNECSRSHICPTIAMWEELYKIISDYFKGVTIADLAAKVPREI